MVNWKFRSVTLATFSSRTKAMLCAPDFRAELATIRSSRSSRRVLSISAIPLPETPKASLTRIVVPASSSSDAAATAVRSSSRVSQAQPRGWRSPSSSATRRL